MCDAPDLASSTQALRESFGKIADRMEEAARRLRAPGAPPDQDLMQELGRASEDFSEIAKRLAREAEALSLSLPPALDLDTVEKGCEALAPLRERSGRLGRARAVLDRFVRLRTDFEGFAPFMVRERDARSRLLDASPEESDLVSIERRLPDLELLLRTVDSPPQERATAREAQKRITEVFDSDIAYEAMHQGFTLHPETEGPDPEDDPDPERAPQQPLEAEDPPEAELSVPQAEAPPAPSDLASPIESPPEPATDSLAEAPIPTEICLEPEAVSPDPRDAEGLAWLLLEEGRPFSAAALLRALSDADVATAHLLEAVGLAPSLRRPDGPVALQLAEPLEALARSGWIPTDTSGHLLLFAATLRPALLSPPTQYEMIQRVRIERSLPTLASLVEFTQRTTQQGLTFNAGLLKGMDSLTSWENELKGLQEATRLWLMQSSSKKSRFARATWVWQSWVARDGVIERLLQAILKHDLSSRAEINREVERLRQKSSFKKVVREAEQRVDAKHARLNPIDGPALNDDLFGWTEEALGLVDEWLALNRRRPAEGRDYLSQTAHEFRNEMHGLLAPARAELQSLRLRSAREVRAAAAVLDAVLSALSGLLDAEVEEPAEDALPATDRLLDLLRVPGLRLTEQGRVDPAQDSASVLAAILEHDVSASWDAVLARLCEKDLGRADRLLDLLQELRLVEAEPLDRLRQIREQAVVTTLGSLQERTEALRGLIDRGAGLILSDKERQDHIAEITSAPTRDEVARFLPYCARIQKIHDDLERRMDERTEEFRKNLKQKPEVSEFLRGRIEEALARRDLLMANALLEMPAQARQEQSASPAPADDPLPRFLQFLRSIKPLGAKSPRDPAWLPAPPPLARQVNGSLSSTLLPDLQLPRKDADELWRAWTKLCHEPQGRGKTACDLLNLIGFQDPQVRRVVDDTSSAWSADITVRPMSDRRLCPLPRFGSAAKGSYHVYFHRRVASVQEILGRIPRNKPSLLVIYPLGVLTADERGDLARACRRDSMSLLLIDEAVIRFLLDERSERLRAFFAVTLPFSQDNPYVLSGPIAPEMFFGRAEERRSILDPAGTNLLYGGRQIGKTALLCDIETRLKDEPDIVCRWLDLKDEGIGIHRPPDDIWVAFADVLSKAGVLSSNRASPETLRDKVQEWLKADESRRILLLLDEADAFLERDSLPGSGESGDSTFQRVTRIKDLMVRTNYRFKVVFAGLHNVQRTTRNPNSPLAHLREPLQIGPFLDDREWREARDLVELPLRTLGFQPDSPDVAIRILSLSNYYPSLIQVFCHHLVKHVETRILRAGTAGPPWRITVQDVDAAYQGQKLRETIRDRIRWTLELDNRYQILALCIMYDSLEPGSRGLVEGFDVDAIGKEARAYWEEGFRRSPAREDIRNLLDEMLGLGVLRKVGANRYALRSPNLLHLFGTREDIASAIERAASEKPPPEYEALHFHRSVKDTTSGRSPLTAMQEARILEAEHAVLLIFGVPAANVTDVAGSVLTLPPETPRRFQGSNFQEFETWLRETERADGEGLNLFVVAPEVEWMPSWVEKAASTVSRFTSRKAWRKVIFIGKPSQTWRWANALRDPARSSERLYVPITLHPWSEGELRRWMDEWSAIPKTRETTDGLLRETGGWPGLLTRFKPPPSLTSRGWEAHVRAKSAEIEQDSSLLDAFGLLPEIRPELGALAVVGEPVSAEDLADLAKDDGLTQTSAQRALDYAELLNLVRRGNGGFSLDPVVARLLRAPRVRP